MVAFTYGEWHYICRVSPQSICNLFFRQLLVHPDRGIQAAPAPYLDLPPDPQERERVIDELGIGIRSSCSIPRMASAGGKSGSVGNIADIIFCCISIIVTFAFLFKASKRKAAVARIEMMIFLILFNIIKFLEILDTGSILRQGSRSIVWITSLHYSFLVLFYFILIWLGFLSLQLVEDGSKFSLAPLLSSCLFLFFGSVYIFLDTGFGITHYFSSQPASNLYSPWTFSMVILWPFIAITIYLTLTILVSVKGLMEKRPAIFTILTMVVLIVGETFRWILNQPICHSSNGTVDGSFAGTIFELIAISLVVYVWICLTESEWGEEEEEEEYEDFAFHSNKFSNQMNYHNPNTEQQFLPGKPSNTNNTTDDHLRNLNPNNLDLRPDLLPLNPAQYNRPESLDIHHLPSPSHHADLNNPSSFHHR